MGGDGLLCRSGGAGVEIVGWRGVAFYGCSLYSLCDLNGDRIGHFSLELGIENGCGWAG